MFLSIRFRRPYSVILIMLIALVIAYSVGSLVAITNKFFTQAIMLTNPAAAMFGVTYSTFPGVRVAVGSFSWPLHCLIMIFASVLMLLASALMIRRSALTQLYHARAKRPLSVLKRMVGLARSGKARRAAAAIRPVRGQAIIWKELGRPISASLRSQIIIFLLLSVALILTCCLGRGAMMVYSILTMGLWMIASVRTVAMAATSIAGEKEARTWPILLGTTLDDWQIIRGKALAVLWRNLPLWLAMIVGHIAFFIFINLSLRGGGPGGPSFYWLYVLGGVITFASHVVLLISVGMYFSVRLRSATAAVISSIGAILGVFILQRFFLTLILQVLTIRMGIQYGGIILFYLVPSLVYVGAGMLLIWRAKCRLRKDIF